MPLFTLRLPILKTSRPHRARHAAKESREGIEGGLERRADRREHAGGGAMAGRGEFDVGAVEGGFGVGFAELRVRVSVRSVYERMGRRGNSPAGVCLL